MKMMIQDREINMISRALYYYSEYCHVNMVREQEAGRIIEFITLKCDLKDAESLIERINQKKNKDMNAWRKKFAEKD